jgi:tetratricopeptide (TPR) repeat protein
MLKAKMSLEIRVVPAIVFFLLIFCAARGAEAANVISGIIYDKQGNTLNAVDVELQDEYYRLLQRARTDSIGRYQFSGLNNGNYTVKALPFQYDMQDQSQYIEIQAISARQGDPGSMYVTQDFYLQPKKGGLKDAELSVIFAQEVPKEAKNAYEKALNSFSRKRDEEAFGELKSAIKIFPTYYNALYRFGLELFLRKQYEESFQVFMKVIEVNPRSATSFFYMGSAFYNLGKEYNKAALTSLKQALILAPASPQVLWMLGRAERRAGRFTEAEKHLLQAKKASSAKTPEILKELSELYANDLKKYKEAADELELYLKASKLKNEEEEKTKNVISNLREKARKQQSTS